MKKAFAASFWAGVGVLVASVSFYVWATLISTYSDHHGVPLLLWLSIPTWAVLITVGAIGYMEETY